MTTGSEPTMAASMVVLTTDHPVAPCVDLRKTCGGAFRYVWDPAYAAERPDLRRIEAAWLTRIPCRFGFIAPHGGRRLQAYSTTRRRALAALPGVSVHAAGERDALVTFDVNDLEAVATLLGARRPPRLSDEERARRRERILAVARSRETSAVPGLGASIGGRALGELGSRAEMGQIGADSREPAPAGAVAAGASE